MSYPVDTFTQCQTNWEHLLMFRTTKRQVAIAAICGKQIGLVID